MYLKAVSKLYECDNSYEVPNIDDYTQAWLLRGDEPSLYENFKNEPTVCSINSYLLCDSIPEMKSYREKPNIKKIYFYINYIFKCIQYKFIRVSITSVVERIVKF